MTAYHLVRDYENPTLSMDLRLPSLARRFHCLEGADGISPWSAADFHSWVMSMGEDTPAWHAGHLLLNIYGKGPWERFDAVAAVRVWSEQEKKIFANWVRGWQA